MNYEIKKALYRRGADIVRFVDISALPSYQTKGYSKAILFCMVLSRKFINDMYNNLKTDSDEYLEKEEKTEKLADWLEKYIKQKGYHAYSQSEKNNLKNGYIESCYIDPNLESGISIIPQKTIARMSGLGFIGKNNLLITEEYGCAFSMCSVLTDAPITTEKHTIITPKCGNCNICKNVCPPNALHGNEWTQFGNRENIVDVSKCCCALKCMVNCPFTLKYTKQIE